MSEPIIDTRAKELEVKPEVKQTTKNAFSEALRNSKSKSKIAREIFAELADVVDSVE